MFNLYLLLKYPSLPIVLTQLSSVNRNTQNRMSLCFIVPVKTIAYEVALILEYNTIFFYLVGMLQRQFIVRWKQHLILMKSMWNFFFHYPWQFGKLYSIFCFLYFEAMQETLETIILKFLHGVKILWSFITKDDVK